MRSTGPILAVGAITVFNESIVNGKPIDWRVPVATGISAAVFALAEHAIGEIAVGIAWIALVGVLFVRINPSIPAPVESFTKWIGP